MPDCLLSERHGDQVYGGVDDGKGRSDGGQGEAAVQEE